MCASLGELEHKSKKKKDNESAASKGPTLAVLDSNNQVSMGPCLQIVVPLVIGGVPI